MPDPSYCPRFAMSAELDLRGIAGALDEGGEPIPVFVRGDPGDPDAPALVIDPDEWCPCELRGYANGFGSRPGHALVDQLQAKIEAITGPGPIVNVGFDDSDFWFIDISGPGAQAFSIKAGADNPCFGIPSAGVASVPDGNGGHRVTGTLGWLRSNLCNKHIVVQFGIQAITLPCEPYCAQGLPTLCRTVGAVGDLDDQLYAEINLEALDNLTADKDDQRIRWGVDECGHVWICWPLATTIDYPVWTNDAFRRLLGFTGRESPEIFDGPLGQVVKLRAECPARFEMASSGPAWIQEITEEYHSAHRTRSGRVASARHPLCKGYVIEFHLDGPLGCKPNHEHWICTWLDAARVGSKVTMTNGYPGETRRRARYCDVVTVDQGPYDCSITTDGNNAFEGRSVLRRSVSDESSRRIEWEQVGRFRKRLRATVRIRLDIAEPGI